MAYLGTPIDTQNQFQSLQGKRFNGDGSTTAFTLDIAPSSVFDIEVFVENVRQDPNSAYSLSGTTLTFTGAPPSGTNNIYVVHQAKAVGTINPGDGTVSQDKLTSGVVAPRVNALPIIINGDMAVAQRATTSTSTGIETCDRWNVRSSNTDNLAITQAQSTTVPGHGFKFSYKYDTTTAESALASDEALAIETRLEANTLQGLKYGTGDAETATLAFWVRGSLTGVHGIYIRTHDGAQEFVQSYNIDAADTWEQKIINIPANTAKVINNDNGIGWWIQWGLAAGTGIDGATLGSWHDNATEIFPSSQVNYMANTSYEFYLTGVQLEIGTYTSTTLPKFQFESFGDNLLRCQRYLNRMVQNGSDSNIRFAVGVCKSGTSSEYGYLVYPELRDTPSVTFSSTSSHYRANSESARSGSSGPSVDNRHKNGCRPALTVSSGQTAGYAAMLEANNDAAFIELDAEL